MQSSYINSRERLLNEKEQGRRDEFERSYVETLKKYVLDLGFPAYHDDDLWEEIFPEDEKDASTLHNRQGAVYLFDLCVQKNTKPETMEGAESDQLGEAILNCYNDLKAGLERARAAALAKNIGGQAKKKKNRAIERLAPFEEGLKRLVQLLSTPFKDNIIPKEKEEKEEKEGSNNPKDTALFEDQLSPKSVNEVKNEIHNNLQKLHKMLETPALFLDDQEKQFHREIRDIIGHDLFIQDDTSDDQEVPEDFQKYRPQLEQLENKYRSSFMHMMFDRWSKIRIEPKKLQDKDFSVSNSPPERLKNFAAYWAKQYSQPKALGTVEDKAEPKAESSRIEMKQSIDIQKFKAIVLTYNSSSCYKVFGKYRSNTIKALRKIANYPVLFASFDENFDFGGGNENLKDILRNSYKKDVSLEVKPETIYPPLVYKKNNQYFVYDLNMEKPIELSDKDTLDYLNRFNFPSTIVAPNDSKLSQNRKVLLKRQLVLDLPTCMIDKFKELKLDDYQYNNKKITPEMVEKAIHSDYKTGQKDLDQPNIGFKALVRLGVFHSTKPPKKSSDYYGTNKVVRRLREEFEIPPYPLAKKQKKMG